MTTHTVLTSKHGQLQLEDTGFNPMLRSLTQSPESPLFSKYENEVRSILKKAEDINSGFASLGLIPGTVRLVKESGLDPIQREKVYVHLSRTLHYETEVSATTQFILNATRFFDLKQGLKESTDRSMLLIEGLYAKHRADYKLHPLDRVKSPILRVVSGCEYYQSTFDDLGCWISNALHELPDSLNQEGLRYRLSDLLSRGQVSLAAHMAVLQFFSSERNVAVFFSRPFERLNEKYRRAVLEENLLQFFTPETIATFKSAEQELEVFAKVLGNLNFDALPHHAAA